MKAAYFFIPFMIAVAAVGSLSLRESDSIMLEKYGYFGGNTGNSNFGHEMKYEIWSHPTALNGDGDVFVTWEPWKPVSGSSQGNAQSEWSNVSIVTGVHDEYLSEFNTQISNYNGKVWLNYGHEMNGNWYPWHNDPAAYVAARQHMHEVMSASNIVWVWSPNANLYQSDSDFLAGTDPYWPGDQYVDAVGMTAINFGTLECWQPPCKNEAKGYPVELLAERYELLHQTYGGIPVLSEVNAPNDVEWWSEFALWADEFELVNIVQPENPRSSDQFETGTLNWNINENDNVLALLTRRN